MKRIYLLRIQYCFVTKVYIYIVLPCVAVLPVLASEYETKTTNAEAMWQSKLRRLQADLRSARLDRNAMLAAMRSDGNSKSSMGIMSNSLHPDAALGVKEESPHVDLSETKRREDDASSPILEPGRTAVPASVLQCSPSWADEGWRGLREAPTAIAAPSLLSASRSVPLLASGGGLSL